MRKERLTIERTEITGNCKRRYRWVAYDCLGRPVARGKWMSSDYSARHNASVVRAALNSVGDLV